MEMVIGVKNTAQNMGLIQAIKRTTNADNSVRSAFAIYHVEALQNYIAQRWKNNLDLGTCIYATHFFEICRAAISDGYMLIIKEVDRNDGFYDFVVEYAQHSTDIKIIDTEVIR